jgi:hypothetical protein
MYIRSNATAMERIVCAIDSVECHLRDMLSQLRVHVLAMLVSGGVTHCKVAEPVDVQVRPKFKRN